MKKPEYTAQVLRERVWVCTVCGSCVVVRNLHDAWHVEQAQLFAESSK